INATYEVKINEQLDKPQLECSYTQKGKVSTKTLDLEPAQEAQKYKGDFPSSIPVKLTKDGLPNTENQPDMRDLLTKRMPDGSYQFEITQLIPNTEYQFEWVFENVLEQSAAKFFNVRTKSEDQPPRINTVLFDRVSEDKLIKAKIQFDDPCPYESARAELTRLLVKFHPEQEPVDCSPVNMTGSSEETMSWSADRPFVCQFRVPDASRDFNTSLTTLNRFGSREPKETIFYASDILRGQMAQQIKGSQNGVTRSHSSVLSLALVNVLIAMVIA
ncbi:hypothetical protein Ciccas_014094, partial [Cichlidogyrus casuarinus]